MHLHKLLFSTLLVSSFLTNTYAGPYDDLYEKGVLTSPAIAHIHGDSLAWRKREESELSKLITYISEHSDRDETLKARIKEDLEGDLAYFSTLTESLNPFVVGKGGTTYQLKTNKMALGIKLALKLLEASFDDLVEGNLPEGYSIASPKVNAIGSKDHIYASGRGVALKHLLIRTAMRLAGVPITGLEKVVGFSPKESPFIHYTPLPTDLKYEGLEASPYFIKGDKGRYVAVLHNGYTFGGHRNEGEEKRYGPHDCSSFVAKYAGCTPVSTWHQAIYYSLQEGFQFTGPQFSSVVKEWEAKKSEYAKDSYIISLGKTMVPVKIFDITEITPGLVHAERTYTSVDTNPSVALTGTGGHTSFTIGTVGKGSDAQLITIGTNRDLPGRDFIFGLEPRPYQADPLKDQKLVMYFDLKL